ncbi:MAG: DEAD/DEAH box helicase [Candidatus Micrarchaeaceae archaeon]
MKEFSEMNLKPELLKNLNKINFIKPTDVQEKVIPVALQGTDVIVRAKTGTGKTAAFLIPILQKCIKSQNPEALIIVPTRELALQIADVAGKLKSSKDSITVIYGGASINVQMHNLRYGSNIIIGTPGRIIDLIKRKALHLNDLKFLVLDEADTMLDMGFIEDIEFIMSKTPSSKQTMLFSATIPEEIKNTAKRHMHNPLFLSIGSEEEMIISKIKHYYTISPNRLKFATLVAYINEYQPKKAIIFVHTKYFANKIYETLKQFNFNIVLLHGGLTQAKREVSVRIFRTHAQFLIATNIAARGLDIQGISHIINFDAPDTPHIYLHRVGRSARMNAEGTAFTIIEPDHKNIINEIEHSTNIKMEKLILNTAQFADMQLQNINTSDNYNRQNYSRDQNHRKRSNYRNKFRRY